MILEKEQWEKFVKGFHVIAGAIGFNNTRYCFVLEETQRNIHRDPPPVVRLLFARMERPLEGRFYSIDFPYFEFPRIASATINGTPQFIITDMDGHVIVYDDIVAEIGPEAQGIPTQWGKQQDTAVRRLKYINGKLYAVCSDRMIQERQDYDRWIKLPGLEQPGARIADPLASNLPFGFSDLDAFGPADIYAAGGKGDVWHYNGKTWRQCAFPATELLHTVCCAGNGLVYLTSQHGNIWAGRGDQWEQLVGTRHNAYNDTVWFKDKLWLSHDTGIEILDEQGLLPAPVIADVHRTARRLQLSEDGQYLLSAGRYGASLYDGKVWQVLFNSIAIDPL